MNIKDIINKKANKKSLTKAEIDFFVKGYVKGEITDYQASALLMAIKINSMTEKETFYLTQAMLGSGDILSFKHLGKIVDKHSSGGVSDTTSIALAPICAVCGVKMLKLSGRGLGHTGGTIDKMEAFSGYNCNLTLSQIEDCLKTNGACIVSATQNLVPADKKLYALRDATATVESLPLIASSIMSKKLASGADVIVLDVKYGDGAFMKTKKDALALAKIMVKIGTMAGKKMDYCLSDTNQPLGYNIGNKLEAYEAVKVLKGQKGALFDTTLDLATKCISLGLNIKPQKARQMAQNAIDSGLALKKLKSMVEFQGGSLDLFDSLSIFPTLKVKSGKSGIVKKIHCQKLGLLVGQMGATRQNINDKIDYNVGVITHHKIGQKVQAGDTLVEIFAPTLALAKNLSRSFADCFVID